MTNKTTAQSHWIWVNMFTFNETHNSELCYIIVSIALQTENTSECFSQGNETASGMFKIVLYQGIII